MLMNLQSGARKSSKAVAMERTSDKTHGTKAEREIYGIIYDENATIFLKSYQARVFYCYIFVFFIYSTQCYASPSCFDLHEHSASPQILLSASLSIRTTAKVWCSSPTKSRIPSG